MSNIETITTTLSLFEFTSTMGILLYWVPVAMCSIGYTSRTWRNYRKDVKARKKAEETTNGYYAPTDTLGSLIGRGLVTIIPGGNILAATFDVAPTMFGRIFSFIGSVFDQPLVPKRK